MITRGGGVHGRQKLSDMIFECSLRGMALGQGLGLDVGGILYRLVYHNKVDNRKPTFVVNKTVFRGGYRISCWEGEGRAS